MASTIIHLAVAKKMEDQLNLKRKNDFYLGVIAPDLSKQIGKSKQISHLLINTKDNVPNMELFEYRHKDFRDFDFDLGYFVHLYTDKLWFENFINKINNSEYIKLLDGSIVKTSSKEMENMIYSDYTNINKQLIDEYNLDLKIFYEEYKIPESHINEIPLNKLDILINKMGLLIENSNEAKPYTFDLKPVKEFIDEAAEIILKEINKE